MTRHKYISEHFERRTYIKGTFKGKYVGLLDRERSDEKHERFFDLEILEGEITTSQDNVLKWYDHEETQGLHIDDTFITRLPGEIIVSLKYIDGTVKYFKVRLQELKLIKCRLSNQQHEGDKVYGMLEGDVSGYLMHYDTLIKEIKEYERPVRTELGNTTSAQVDQGSTKGDSKRALSGNGCRNNFAFILGLLVLLGVLLMAPHAFLPVLTLFIGALSILGVSGWLIRKFNLRAPTILAIILGLVLSTIVIFFLVEMYSKSTKRDALIKNPDGKNYKKNIQDYSDLITQNPTNAGYYYKRAICYSEVGLKQEAVADLKKAMELGDTSAGLLYDQINPVKTRYRYISHCRDSTISNSTGSGTCSHHGGVMRKEKIYEKYREYK